MQAGPGSSLAKVKCRADFPSAEFKLVPSKVLKPKVSRDQWDQQGVWGPPQGLHEEQG